MRRLLIDVTRTVQSGHHTGIQRVVRRLWRALQEAGTHQPVRVQAVAFSGAQWFAIDHLPSHPLETAMAMPPMGVQTPLDAPRGRCIKPNQGDVLLMADASWYLDPWPAVDAAMRDGADLVGFVHDLFPLLQPQWFKPELQPRFAAHFEKLVERASLLLTPSMAVKRAVDAHLKQRNAHGVALAVRCQPLGANFLLPGCMAQTRLDATAKLPAPLATDTEFALMVGTIEPRKNHATLLNAFDRLWERGSAMQLVLVGAPGWCSDALLKRLETHPERGLRLHWLRSQSDAQLYALYTQASALVFPSLDEGFGLPLAEAAHLGCAVLASDLPVLHEVGGHWPTYLPALDAQQWAKALHQLTVAPASVAPTYTWAEVASQLLSTLEAMEQRSRTTEVEACV
jgi:glycosyltransferase involved in cell wall biosynthesis